MAKKTYKITRFDGGRNSKYDPRDIAEEEIAEAVNIGVTNPGYFTPSGNFKGYWNASDNAVQTYTVTEFERTGTNTSDDNTSLFAFAHDYGMLFKVHIKEGHDELLVVGATVSDGGQGAGASGASGVVVASTTTSGSDESYVGYIYLKDVTQSTLTAVTGDNPWIENNILRVGGSEMGKVSSEGATVVASTSSPMLCFADGNTVDIYDDGGSQWIKQVMTLDANDTWNGTSSDVNATNVFAKMFFENGALRFNDANFSNTNNNSKWFGHIKREYLQNIVEHDGTAKTRDVVKYNSWFEDAMAPAPPSNTNEKALTVMDTYVESYPTRGEKVLLRLRESTVGQVEISAFAVDTATNEITATCSNHSTLGLTVGSFVVIDGTSHSGRFEISGVPDTTSFKFFGNDSSTLSSLTGSDVMQNGSAPGNTGWTERDTDGGTNGWLTFGADTSPITFDQSADEVSSAINTLSGNAIDKDITHMLTFAVSGSHPLWLAIGGGDLTDNYPDEQYVGITEYAVGDHTVIFTPAADATHLWLTGVPLSTGDASLDTITLKPLTCTARADSEAIKQDFKDKWIFAVTHMYEGITSQESPITVGQKYDGTNYYVMDLDDSANYVVDFTNFVNKPECDISFVYDDINYDAAGSATNRWWHPRKTGFKIYMKRASTDGGGEWLMFAEVDFIRGEYRVNAGTGTILPLHQGYSNPEYEVNLGGGQSLAQFNNVILDSYYTETLGVSEHLTHFKVRYKTQAIVNRVNWIGNVLVDGETYPDRLMKSPPLRYDIFPNDESYTVDVIPSDGDEITHLESFADKLLVFKNYSLVIVNVSSSIETIESVNKGVGVINSRGVCATDTGIAWLNKQGLMHYDGEKIENLISEKFNTVDNWLVGANSILAYDSVAKQLVILNVQTGTSVTIGHVYDFFTKSFFYGFGMFSVYDSGGNNFSNIVNVPIDRKLVVANTNSTSSAYTVKFRTYESSPQTTIASSEIAAINTFGFVLKTKDIDFGEPGVKKKIYKVYITYKEPDDSEDHANVVVAYNVNGKNSATIDSITHTDSGYQHFKALENCQTVSRDVGGGNHCVLLNEKDDWTTAVIKPEDTTANNVYSFQLVFYNKNDQAVSSTFKVNDITIVYRMKKKK